MRIWLAPSAFLPHRGGVEELTLKLAQHLVAGGHDVLVVVHRHPNHLPSDEVVEGVAVKRLTFPVPGRKGAQLAQFGVHHLRVQSELSALDRPDVLHIQCPSNQTLPIALFAARTKLPLVLTSQGEVVMDASGIYQRSAYMRASLRFGAKRASAVTACSSWTASEASRFASQFRHAATILNGIDPDDWTTQPVPDSPTFCAWGRHVPQKGLDLAIAAFERVRATNPLSRLLVGGDGPDRQKLEALAGDGVEFLGSLSREGVRDMLNRSRVAVVPSRIEPFGIVALEALASGRELVYSSIAGGLGEAAGSRGYPVDPNDEEAFAQALTWAASRPVDDQSNRARAQELCWTAVTAQYTDLYTQVIRGSLSRRPAGTRPGVQPPLPPR